MFIECSRSSIGANSLPSTSRNSAPTVSPVPPLLFGSISALVAAGEPYFRPYDLRHTCATLLIYEGRPVTEVAAHMGHADPGFTARVYGHVFSDAARRRHVPIEQAIAEARALARTAQA